MRKQITIFSILFLFSSVSGVQINNLDTFKTQEKIREFQPTQKGDFQIVINTEHHSILRNSKREVSSFYASGQTARSIQTRVYSRERLWLTGFQFGNSKAIIFHKNGSIKLSANRYIAHDRGALLSNKSFYSSNGFNTYVYNSKGIKRKKVNLKGGFRTVSDKGDIDNDGLTELFLEDTRDNYYTSIQEDGTLEWRISNNPPEKTRIISKNRLLAWSDQELSLIHAENSSSKWHLKDKIISNPVNLSNSVVYPSDNSLVFVDEQDGSLIKRKEYSSKIRKLKKFPDRDLVVGFQGSNISFFGTDGSKLSSFRVDNLRKEPKFTSYDNDSRMELAVVSGKSVRILDIETKGSSINQGLNETVFVGNGREMLKAVALNQTSFITESFDKVEDEVGETGLKPVSVNIEGPNSTEDVNEAFNVSKPKYYAGDQEQAVYVAALAAKNNASLTFEKSEADRDFSNYSMVELQQRFIEEFKPNHLVVADLDSDKGVLSAYMAVKQGSLPVDFSEDYSYPESYVDTDKWNSNNGVISLENKIEQKFKMIGSNRKTVFEGKYVSLLDAPRRMNEDPVEPGLISDPADGEKYYSDLGYGNLDSDRYLEAGVGRYPEQVSDSSKVFHRSMNREIGSEALVASEYLHSNWPVILATFGGGMRYGEVTRKILDREGFETTHLIERRSQPVSFLFDLLGVPTPMDGFVKTVDGSQEHIASKLTEGSARAIKNAAYMIRGLKYSQQAMQMYFEFKWSSWEPVDQELDMPQEVSRSEFGDLVLSFLPDWKPELTEQKLVDEMKTSDIIYYQGIGDQKNWVLPNKDNSKLLSNRYNGSNSLKSNELPELDNPIVFDSSNMAGSRNAEMRKAFVDNGASAFIGFSGVNYASYSSHTDQIFFKNGKTLGNSMKKAVNSLRKGSAIYNPSSRHVFGAAEKMKNSAIMYGNPEMKKDPITSDKWNISKTCSRGKCRVKMELNPKIRTKKTENGKRLLEFDTDDYLLVPEAPITPLYSRGYSLPAESKVEKIRVSSDYRQLQNIYLPKHHLLSHGGNYSNISKSYEIFPKTVSNTSKSEKQFRVVQSGLQKKENITEVLDGLNVNLTYKAPLTAKLERKNRAVKARVYSNQSATAKMIYRVGENKSSRKRVELEQGINSFKIDDLETGKTEADLYIVDHEVLAQAHSRFTVKKEPEIQVFAPDIHKGDVRNVRAVVENTNNFSVTEKIRVQTDESIQLGMLEKPERTISLEPNGVKTVSWRFTGIKKGNSSVNIVNSSDNLEVVAARSKETYLNTGRFYRSLNSPYRVLKSQRTDSKLKLNLKTDIGRLKILKKPGYEYRLLETDKFKAIVNQSSRRQLQRVESSNGFYQRSTSKGSVKIRSENMTEKRAERLLEKLNHESRKIKKAHRSSRRRLR